MENTFTKPLEVLIKQYENRKHPLNYKNRYQLVVMVILSAQDSDKHINELTPAFFSSYPDMQSLSTLTPDDLHSYFSTVRNFGNKCEWLIKLAQHVRTDDNIPSTLPELTKLPGIGRKSANVIIRESGGQAEGVIVDLHVVRVAPRLGVAKGIQPEKIEKQLMQAMSREHWNNLGMAISFLGREICRPTSPKCNQCIMNEVCYHFNNITDSEVSLELF
jgi:endonuclease-3